MITTKRPAEKGTSRGDSQIVGFRLPRQLAREVKAEAARRGIKFNELFAELWNGYRKQRSNRRP